MMLEIVQKTGQGIRFYHPDHLGSTTVVTDLDGEVTQNVAYIPYGEVFVEQQNGTWNTPYLFNAKELDEETGLYYYGARYLDPTGTRWLSVDPLFEKYVGATPYNYCEANPIRYIDIDGRENVEKYDRTDSKNRLNICKAKNYPTNNKVIDFHGHGNQFSIGDNSYSIKNGKEFNEFLMNNSSLWAKRSEQKEKSFISIRLHSCNTGKGENNIAKQISESDEFKDVLIVAPTTKVQNYGKENANTGKIIPGSCKEIGAFKYYPDYYDPDLGVAIGVGEGEWNFYYNGKVIGTFSNDKTNEIMKSPKKIEELIKDYLKKQNENENNNQ